jgi:hypothetical protein
MSTTYYFVKPGSKFHFDRKCRAITHVQVVHKHTTYNDIDPNKQCGICTLSKKRKGGGSDVSDVEYDNDSPEAWNWLPEPHEEDEQPHVTLEESLAILARDLFSAVLGIERDEAALPVKKRFK